MALLRIECLSTCRMWLEAMVEVHSEEGNCHQYGGTEDRLGNGAAIAFVAEEKDQAAQKDDGDGRDNASIKKDVEGSCTARRVLATDEEQIDAHRQHAQDRQQHAIHGIDCALVTLLAAPVKPEQQRNQHQSGQNNQYGCE